jgi:pimeloyl-ACP methyl ester carboxylesterase
MMIATSRGRFDVLDRGEGTRLVLVHGFPFAADSWSGDVDALTSSMRIVVPSMRGFGETPAQDLDALSIDAMADDVAAILDTLGVSVPVVVGGLSMGGYVALAFARRHPRRLRGLLLVDTRAEPDGAEARANRERGIARIEGGDLAGFVADLLPAILAPTTIEHRPDVVAHVRALAMSAAPSSVIAMLRALRDRPDAARVCRPSPFQCR